MLSETPRRHARRNPCLSRQCHCGLAAAASHSPRADRAGLRAGGHGRRPDLRARRSWGPDEASARQRIERDVRGAFDVMSRGLQAIARGVADPAALVAAARDDEGAARTLFDAAQAAAVAHTSDVELAVTAYATAGRPLAWAGRPSELPKDRLEGDEAWFIAQGALGLRLVYAMPVNDASGTPRRHDCRRAVDPPAEPVRRRRPRRSIPVSRPAHARIARARVRRGAHHSRSRIASTSSAPTAGTWSPRSSRRPTSRRRAAAGAARPRRSPRSPVRSSCCCCAGRCWTGGIHSATGSGIGIKRGSRVLVPARYTWSPSSYGSGDRRQPDPLPPRLAGRLVRRGDLLGRGIRLAAAAPAADVAVRLPRDRRLCRRTRRTAALLARGMAPELAPRAAPGRLAARRDPVFRIAARRWFRRRRASARPSGAARRHDRQHHARPAALLAASVEHGAPRAADRHRRLGRHGAWLRRADPSSGVSAVAPRAQQLASPPRHGRVLDAAACRAGVTPDARRVPAVPSRSFSRLRWRCWPDSSPRASRDAIARDRRRSASRCSRSAWCCRRLPCTRPCFQLARQAKLELVETRYGPQALNQRQTIQTLMEQSLQQIDAFPGLTDLVSVPPGPAGSEAVTDRAFQVWRVTGLATYPITSSVELFGPDGRLVSRFAFNLPDDLNAVPTSEERVCSWDIFEEVSPFFAVERRVLSASRAVCVNDPSGASHVVGSDRSSCTRCSTTRTFRSSRRRARTWSCCGRRSRSAKKACRAATSSSPSTAGAARRSTRPPTPRGKWTMGCSRAWWKARRRSGRGCSAADSRTTSTC